MNVCDTIILKDILWVYVKEILLSYFIYDIYNNT